MLPSHMYGTVKNTLLHSAVQHSAVQWKWTSLKTPEARGPRSDPRARARVAGSRGTPQRRCAGACCFSSFRLLTVWTANQIDGTDAEGTR